MVFCFLVFGAEKQIKRESLLASSSVSFDASFGSEEKVFFKQKDLVMLEFPQSIVIEKNSFKSSAPTELVKTRVLGSLAVERELTTREEIIEYAVEKGDTVSSIAEKFGISVETILWANNLSSNSKIVSGKTLTILPVSGIMHLVGNGESLGYLAERYKTKIAEIKEFNDVSEKGEIFIGDLLVIPGGRMPPPSQSSVQYAASKSNILMANSYFICPIPAPCSVTQGLHYYNAIDFSNGQCGETVFAAAGGKVQKTGFHSIAGKYVRILHPNGVVTLYGHFSTVLVSAGQTVLQGQIIGYTGNTGYTIGRTGCHVHFEVRGAPNPFR